LTVDLGAPDDRAQSNSPLVATGRDDNVPWV
jgi:hypothetical protein